MTTARWLILMFLMLCAGCGASPRGVARWEAQQGGLCTDVALRQRLDRVCRPLRAIDGLGRCELAVIDSAAASAYAWPTEGGGRVYVTRGLMALTSDDELAAAVAHEMGHLIDGGHVDVAALTGADYDDAERRADVIGCRLLRAVEIPQDALRDLLHKLANNHVPRRASLLARANHLSR